MCSSDLAARGDGCLAPGAPPLRRWNMNRFSASGLLLVSCWVGFASDAPPPREVVDVAALVRQLGSADFNEREAASDQLAALRVGEPPAELLAALKSSDPEVRDRAAKAVAAIRARPIVPIMVSSDRKSVV